MASLPWKARACILAALLSCALYAFAQAGPHQPSTPEVTRVSVTLDVSQLPAADQADPRVLAWGELAVAMAQEQFVPLTVLLYPDDPLPARLCATLQLIRQDDGIAWTGGGVMTANMTYFDNYPGDVGAIFHELAHVVQSYSRNDEGWLCEGIADWARYFWYEKRTLASYRSAGPGSYTDGYTNAARFLEWLRKYKNGAIVRRLNAIMRADGSMSDESWTQLCGASLDALWREYARWCEKQAGG